MFVTSKAGVSFREDHRLQLLPKRIHHGPKKPFDFYPFKSKIKVKLRVHVASDLKKMSDRREGRGSSAYYHMEIHSPPVE